MLSRNHGISERSYRAVWSVFRTEDLVVKAMDDGTLAVEVADHEPQAPLTGKFLTQFFFYILK
jgi:hypothetical protein